jgi:asparagine synthase (glutamine-hydrolysing)
MCGISLVLDFGAVRTPMLHALAEAHAMQAHRGPDDEGWLLVDADLAARRYGTLPPPSDVSTPRLGIAFRRLCIQDLSDEAAQPFGAPDGRQWIVLNGEIYNHAALRDELRARGHAFHTCSDTEVALAAYREWGRECFGRFDGMWAILIVDLTRGRLVGSRDRLGIKPLFFSLEPGRLSLASEPQALAHASSNGPYIELQRYHEFLSGWPPSSASLSFFRDVHPVPAATTFEVDLRDAVSATPDFRRYWSLAAAPLDARDVPPYERAVEQFRDLLDQAVHSHLGSAVPMGCLLSGGLDASFVASTAARRATAVSGTPVPSYSITFDDPEMSEWPFIQSVAAATGLASHTLTLTPRAVWDSVDDVVRAQGQPLLGQELIAQYIVYRLARSHGSIVVLEGQGADELLAGLPGYAAAYLRDLLFGGDIVELVREARAGARRSGESMARVLATSLSAGRPRWLHSGRAYRWLEPSPDSPERLERSEDPSRLNQYLYKLVRHTNLPTVLLHQDRSAMAHGVESRVPFLDHRVVEFCFRLPASYKVHRGARKRILLDAARGLLPDLVLRRTDKKRYISKDSWMPLRREYGPDLAAMARSKSLLESPGVRGRAVAPFVDDYLAGRHDDGLGVWRLYTAWRWLEAFHPA